jgi:beta-1,4-mannosyltransferase
MSTRELVAVKALFRRARPGYSKEQFMSAVPNQTAKTVISVLPLRIAWKTDFVNLMSQELSRQGYIAREFSWRSFGLRTSFVFLHWPNEFFVYKGKVAITKLLIKLAIMRTAKQLWGVKFIWIAHNAAPHDATNSASFIRRWFLRSLDGVIFLSEYSRGLINGLYPEIGKCNALVTVHSHYRSASVTRETLGTRPTGNIKLVHFGLIRPYKNIEALVGAASSISSGIDLYVAGMVMDRVVGAAIRESARLSPHITLDFREDPISDAELEAIVDSADAVVLPYKNILNSGAALFSLSRNRPILAPNMGSLPELRDAVGQEWVYLYDGDFNQQVLVDFREWMFRTQRASVAPLEAYELSRLGNDLRGFIETMNSQRNVTADLASSREQRNA